MLLAPFLHHIEATYQNKITVQNKKWKYLFAHLLVWIFFSPFWLFLALLVSRSFFCKAFCGINTSSPCQSFVYFMNQQLS